MSFKIVEWYVVAMIPRHTSSIPTADVVFPRLLYCDSRCSQTCHKCAEAWRWHSQACCRFSQVLPGAPRLVVGAPRCSHVHPKFSPALPGVPKLITITPMVLLYQSSEIPVTPKAGRNTLLGSHTLLTLKHLSLHSTSSQTLREAPSD